MSFTSSKEKEKSIMKKIFQYTLLLASLLIILAGCGTTTGGEEAGQGGDETIRVAITSGSGPSYVWEAAEKVLKDQGHDVQTEVFTDFNSPNAAVAEGSLDFTFHQTAQFLDQWNSSNGGGLSTVGDGIFSVFTTIISTKIDSLEDVEEGMKVIVANDNVNRAFGLNTLAAAELIQLKEGVEQPSLQDITENPYNLEFVQVDNSLIAKSYQDVDFAVLDTSRFAAAGLGAEDALFSHQNEGTTLYLAAASENLESEKTQIVYDALTSPEVKEHIESNYSGIFEANF